MAWSGYLDRIREKHGGKVLLVDAGDIYQGTLISNYGEGKVMVAAYNTLGYHAAAVGNHDFDFGPGKAGSSDRLAVIKQRTAEASFPVLALNVFEKATKKRVEWPNTAPSRLVKMARPSPKPPCP